jgi:hypothetical protein
VEDVWALPTPGGPGELRRLVSQMASTDFLDEAPRLVSALVTVREMIGRVLNLDGRGTGLGARVTSLRDRLPPDLQDVPAGPDFAPLNSVFLLDDEFAAELANRTVHSVMHIGWVKDGAGGYRGQMAILVKPNGRLGAAYVAAIKPFRYLIVYPALLLWIRRGWRSSASLSDSGRDLPFAGRPGD